MSNGGTSGMGSHGERPSRGEARRQKSIGPWAIPGYPGGLGVPGAVDTWVNDPWSRRDRAIPIAVVQEHRFAFHSWNKWRRGRRGEPPARPTLLTIDWHTDTGSNGEDILDAVDLDNDSEVALFCWSQLCPNNDGQICAAAWLDVIGDVIVLCKQSEPDSYDYGTRRGSSRFTILHDPAEFVERAIAVEGPTILDIDLDYFTAHDEESDGSGGGIVLDEMENLLRPSGPLLSAIGPELLGVSIATEPECCGGFHASARILAELEQTMFDGAVGTHELRWANTRPG